MGDSTEELIQATEELLEASDKSNEKTQKYIENLEDRFKETMEKFGACVQLNEKMFQRYKQATEINIKFLRLFGQMRGKLEFARSAFGLLSEGKVSPENMHEACSESEQELANFIKALEEGGFDAETLNAGQADLHSMSDGSPGTPRTG